MDNSTYLDITDPLGDRGRDQHGRRRDAAGDEKDRAQLALGQIKLATEEICHP